jgi:hypothetical protein
MITLSSALMSFSAFSQLYEAQGQAAIKDGNTEAARAAAMENGLKKALLVAGASVSSVQQVVNGLLMQNDISIRASGSVNALEIISELHTDNLITVTIRADIYPQKEQCFSADFKKSLLLTHSQILHREHANIGKIYAIDKTAIEVLTEKIRQNSEHINAKSSLKYKTEFSRLNKNMQFEHIKRLVMSLADRSDSHYVLFSEIIDLSFNDEKINSWQPWQRDRFERYFSMNLYVYNGNNGEMVYQKKYQGIAPWEFNKRKNVDVNSQVFWRSAYGEMVDQTLASLVKDIDENIMCEPTRAKIVQVEGNKITLNLGSRNGVKVGDEFSLLHKSNFISDSGMTYAGFNVSDHQVRIIKVSRESAIAVTPDERLLGNIQRNDLAVRHQKIL